MEKSQHKHPTENQASKTSSIKSFIGRFPLAVFVLVLFTLVALIVAGNILRKPAQKAAEKAKAPIEVQTFNIGNAPRLKTQAVIEKSGVVKIVAQNGGVVQQIYQKEGAKVWRGTNIVWLSTNYQGGTASTLTRQKAQKSYESARDNLQLNVDLINKQREKADTNRDNQEQLRQISEKSLDDTRSTLGATSDALNGVNNSISQLEQLPTRTPEQESALLGLKAQRAQLQGSLSTLNNSLRSTEYNTNKDNPPTKLNDIDKDITKKNLDLQEKSLNLQVEVSKLDYNLAQVSEGLSYPSSPVAGVVERIHVKIGQVVNPGDLIATITANNNSATAVLLVSRDVAMNLSKAEPSIIRVNGMAFEVTPSYISTEPTSGSLHSVLFPIPPDFEDTFSNGSYVQVDLPIGYADTGSTVPFIPIDSVYQTQDKAYVFVAEKNSKNQTIAKTREIEVGEVYGNYVEVKSGLKSDDKVILNRTVLDNDPVITKEDTIQETLIKPQPPRTGGRK